MAGLGVGGWLEDGADSAQNGIYGVSHPWSWTCQDHFCSRLATSHIRVTNADFLTDCSQHILGHATLQ